MAKEAGETLSAASRLPPSGPPPRRLHAPPISPCAEARRALLSELPDSRAENGCRPSVTASLCLGPVAFCPRPGHARGTLSRGTRAPPSPGSRADAHPLRSTALSPEVKGVAPPAGLGFVFHQHKRPPHGLAPRGRRLQDAARRRHALRAARSALSFSLALKRLSPVRAGRCGPSSRRAPDRWSVPAPRSGRPSRRCGPRSRVGSQLWPRAHAPGVEFKQRSAPAGRPLLPDDGRPAKRSACPTRKSHFRAVFVRGLGDPRARAPSPAAHTPVPHTGCRGSCSSVLSPSRLRGTPGWPTFAGPCAAAAQPRPRCLPGAGLTQRAACGCFPLTCG